MFDRDTQIFIILLACLLLINILPLPGPVRAVLFVILVILQALFIYNGLTRKK